MELSLSHDPVSRKCSLSSTIILLGFLTFLVIQLTRKPETSVIWLLSGKGWGISAARLIHIMGLFWDGSQCRTALDLDEAMLATRKFWFEKPVEQDERWANVLRVYATSDMWPEVPLPCKKTFCTHCLIQKILPLVLMAFLILLGGYSLKSLWMPW